MSMMTTRMELHIDKTRSRRVLEKVGLYDICKVIGKGNFALVRVAKHRIAKCKVAIKIVDKHQVSQENLMKIEREIRILKTLDHPHIIKLYEVMRTEQYIYIVTEYARNGELFDKVLSAHGKLPEAESRKYFQQIVSAVAYCHHRGIVHRDIKAENILLDRNNDVKLIDFGFSNIQQPKTLMSTWCGSPPYAAPELLLGKVYDGTKADIWSLGVVLFIMVTGGFPFAGENVEKLKNAIVAGQLRIPFWVAPDCCDLLRKMIVVYPERRINIDSVAQHRWVVAEMPKELRKLIRETPVDRLFPDSAVFKLDKIISYYMNLHGKWTEAQISEEVMKRNYESPIFATYELFNSKLERKADSQETVEVAAQPRRGSRGSITTGKANIDDEPSPPTLPARSLAILSLSDSSDEELEDDFEKDDLSLSPAESWLCHAAQLGPVVGVEDPPASLCRAEARRHTLVGISELDNLYTTHQLLSKEPYAAAVLAANRAAAATYASRLTNPFMEPLANAQMQNTLSLYSRILTLPSSERRASAGNSQQCGLSAMPSQITDHNFNAHYNADGGLLSYSPDVPSTSGASAASAAVANVNIPGHSLHPCGLGPLSVEEEGEMYLKRSGHSKRNTFHCLSGSPASTSGFSSTRRSPYTRQPTSHERRSSWTSAFYNLTGQQQLQLERLYKQSTGGGEQPTNIQQLQKEFKELNASFQIQTSGNSLDLQSQRNCPPLISITDENNCVQMPLPTTFFNKDLPKAQMAQTSMEPESSKEARGSQGNDESLSAMELMPPSENSVVISFLDTDIVLQQLRSTLDNLEIEYQETSLENHRICVENGEKSRIEIDIIPVPLSISQAKSRIEFNCTGSDTTGCGELCTELIKKLKIIA